MPTKIEVQISKAFGHVHVKTIKDGVLHRHVISPGQDYSNEPKKVRDACMKTHTPEVIAKFKGHKEKMLSGLPG